jgi:hypothetical protein
MAGSCKERNEGIKERSEGDWLERKRERKIGRRQGEVRGRGREKGRGKEGGRKL